MGRVHFIGGEKGGVGKSLTARLLAQYFIDSATPFTGFDSDQSHGSFSRFYKDFASPLRVDDYDSLDNIIDVAETQPGHDLIIDLAAQTSARLGQWIEESDVFGIFTDMGHKVFIWHVMDDGADALSLLDKTLDSYPQQDIQFIVVQNMGRGENFDAFEQSPIFQKAQQRNAYCMTLGKLHAKLVQKVDFNDLSFWAAANNRDLMSTPERQRMRVWLENAYTQFDHFLKHDDIAETPEG
ncbi:MAG TPA: mobilization protein [Candidatus Thiothrix moscowensis]|uniref:mobilization protein n=1 Tax=unclassified Thiothrix TaxID=2636184 RepID=UPI0025D27EDC|nr:MULTISPECIES: mobilization protein [unclassified Thiothrix]HRJ54547.1 mobilization protein [Candidatus Thiothrix moscowensis]HRJ94885.1 mobilization protein [Candidatus Thiothrix moscowensis]